MKNITPTNSLMRYVEGIAVVWRGNFSYTKASLGTQEESI
jgi:hypothetical protein